VDPHRLAGASHGSISIGVFASQIEESMNSPKIRLILWMLAFCLVFTISVSPSFAQTQPSSTDTTSPDTTKKPKKKSKKANAAADNQATADDKSATSNEKPTKKSKKTKKDESATTSA